jgi:multidrug efflux pump subunit AcrA (membrane-fusion protein)
MWVIKTGLKSGEQVVVEGQQALQTGMLVSPTPFRDSTSENK